MEGRRSSEGHRTSPNDRGEGATAKLAGEEGYGGQGKGSISSRDRQSRAFFACVSKNPVVCG